MKNMICFLMKIQINTKKLIQNSILIPIKTTIFLSVLLFIFGGLLCSLGFCLVVCAVVVLYFGYKDREIDVFRYKTP